MSKFALIMDDGITGHRLQGLALAKALGLESRVLSLQPSWLAKRLAPRGLFLSTAFSDEFDTALTEKPDIVIGCGRLAALATRITKHRGIASVQLMNPRLPSSEWSAVLAPAHDHVEGENVFSHIGSLHDINAQTLQAAREQFSALGELKSPRTALLLGGPSRHSQFNRGALEVLLAKLEFTLAKQAGSVMICGSRRTPKEFAPLLRERYAAQGIVWMDDSDGENIYRGALAWADRIICSPDSVNMISEACATSAPVFIAEPKRSTGRIGEFLHTLINNGRARAQDQGLETYTSTPLNETVRAAQWLKEKLDL